MRSMGHKGHRSRVRREHKVEEALRPQVVGKPHVGTLGARDPLTAGGMRHMRRVAPPVRRQDVSSRPHRLAAWPAGLKAASPATLPALPTMPVANARARAPRLPFFEVAEGGQFAAAPQKPRRPR